MVDKNAIIVDSMRQRMVDIVKEFRFIQFFKKFYVLFKCYILLNVKRVVLN